MRLGRARQVWRLDRRLRQPAFVPARNAGAARYYVPESLADDPDCFPAEARPVQEFSVFTSRNYSENFARQYVDATRLLLGSMRSGVRPAPSFVRCCRFRASCCRATRGAGARDDPVVHPDRRLQAPVSPAQAAFATLHLNNVAYMQHRYWRAAEPERFRESSA